MQTQSDSLTKFLATWGAILGTFGLGWSLYRDLLDRVKLQISATVRRIGISPDGRYYAIAPNVRLAASEKLFVVMTVVNVGRRPVLWEGWGGDHQRARPRDQHGDAVASLDHPRARPLKIEREDFDTPGINNDVLARGEKRHEQR